VNFQKSGWGYIIVFNVYTTFDPKDYLVYGKNFIKSFLNNWPEDIKLYIYYEGQPEIDNSRVIWVDFNKECSDQKEFAIRGTKYRQDHFYKGATKFSYKGFTIINHLEKNLDRFNIWLDADTITTNPVTFEWLNSLKSSETCVSVLLRSSRAIESGFILTDNKHPSYNCFLHSYTDYYRKDLLYQLPEWHDGYILTVVLIQNSIPVFNLTPNNEYAEVHPFSTGILGQCLDHLKGPRKNIGFSQERKKYWR